MLNFEDKIWIAVTLALTTSEIAQPPLVRRGASYVPSLGHHKRTTPNNISSDESVVIKY